MTAWTYRRQSHQTNDSFPRLNRLTCNSKIVLWMRLFSEKTEEHNGSFKQEQSLFTGYNVSGPRLNTPTGHGPGKSITLNGKKDKIMRLSQWTEYKTLCHCNDNNLIITEEPYPKLFLDKRARLQVRLFCANPSQETWGKSRSFGR